MNGKWRSGTLHCAFNSASDNCLFAMALQSNCKVWLGKEEEPAKKKKRILQNHDLLPSAFVYTLKMVIIKDKTQHKYNNFILWQCSRIEHICAIKSCKHEMKEIKFCPATKAEKREEKKHKK